MNNNINENIDILDLDNGTEKNGDLQESDLIQKLKQKIVIKNVFLIILAFFSLLSVVCIMLLYFIYNGQIYKFINTYKKNNLSAEVKATESNINSTYLDSKKIAEKISYIDAVLKSNFYYHIDDKKIENGIYSGMMAGLNDRYAAYYSPKELEAFMESTSGEYYGIGATVTEIQATQDYMVVDITENSPADKAGFKVGDIFYSINGESIKGLSLNDLVDKIKGEEGSHVKVEVYRFDKGLVELDVERGKIENQTTKAKMLDDEIGFISVSEFETVTANQFKKAIEQLQEDGMKKLIIDLRGNPGGNLDTVLEMIDYILPDKIGLYTNNTDDFDPGKTLMVYMRDRVEIAETYYCNDNHSTNFPIAILIDSSSASASELFSQCLKDYKYAFTVGEKSFGKGIVQNMVNLVDGSAVKFTILEYFSPSSYEIQGKGIMPTYAIDSDSNNLIYKEDGSIIISSKYDISKEILETLFHDEEENIEEIKERLDVMYEEEPEEDLNNQPSEENVTNVEEEIEENNFESIIEKFPNGDAPISEEDNLSPDNIKNEVSVKRIYTASQSNLENKINCQGIDTIDNNSLQQSKEESKNVSTESEIVATSNVVYKKKVREVKIFGSILEDEHRQYEDRYFLDNYLLEKNINSIDVQLCKAYEMLKKNAYEFAKEINAD